MMSNLLAAVVIFLGSATDQGPRQETLPPLCKVALRLKGRVLGSLIRRGMTIGEVERLLGKDPFPCRSYSSRNPGSISFSERIVVYHDLGVIVSLAGQGEDEPRVCLVGFLPLLD